MLKIPFQDITRFGQQTMLDRPLFNVSWILGRFCNYKCSYCWPYANTDKPDHLELDLYKKTVDNIKQQALSNGFNEFHFSFSGGEPTAYKHFGDLVEYYANDDQPTYQSIHMTTNLSPGSKWWNRFIELQGLQRKSITASFHAEFAKEQEFADKCLQLMNGGVYVTVNQVMVPEHFEEYYERCSRFADKGINVTLKPQSDLTASRIVDGYTEEQIQKLQTGFPQKVNEEQLYQVRLNDGTKDYFLDQAERFNAFGFNKFENWNCNSGYQSCVIIGDYVKRAYSCKEEPLGTLQGGFKLFKTPSKCVTSTCVSSADSKIPKKK